jgi:hypothetical protein
MGIKLDMIRLKAKVIEQSIDEPKYNVSAF